MKISTVYPAADCAPVTSNRADIALGPVGIETNSDAKSQWSEDLSAPSPDFFVSEYEAQDSVRRRIGTEFSSLSRQNLIYRLLNCALCIPLVGIRPKGLY